MLYATDKRVPIAIAQIIATISPFRKLDLFAVFDIYPSCLETPHVSTGIAFGDTCVFKSSGANYSTKYLK